MLRQRVNKLGWIAGAGLVALALTAAPARADHRHADIVVPVVTAFALGALWSQGHGEHYYRHGYRYKYHGYNRHGYKHRGYKRHGYDRHGYGRHGHKHRYSASRGGYHGSKHRH